MAKIKLINPTSYKVETVEDSEATERLRSGQYELVPGKRVRVVDPEGKLFEMDVEDAHSAIQNGYELDTEEKKAKRKLSKEYGGKDAEALLYSGLRGATFGLSDVIATQTGLATPEHLNLLEEHNPDVSFAGEAAGTVGGILMSGGTGPAAKTLGLASKGVLGAGKAAEKTLASALNKTGMSASKSLAQKIVARAAPTAIGGTVEGALVGGGELLSEHALGRADLNAENFISHVGLGSVIGGAGNVLLKGAEAAIPAFTKPVKDLGASIYKQTIAPEKSALKLYGITPAKAIKMSEDGVTPYDISEITLRKLVPEKGDDFINKFDSVLAEDTNALQGLYQQADTVVAQSGQAPNVFQKEKYVKLVQDRLDTMTSSLEASQARELRRLKKDLEADSLFPVTRNEANALVQDMSLGPFQKAKAVLDKVDEFAKHDKLAKPTALQQMAQDLRKELRNDINNGIKQLADNPNIADDSVRKLFSEIKQKNRDMHVMLKLKEFVDAKDTKQFTDDIISFSTAVKMAAGGAIADLPGAIAALGIRLGNMDGIELAKMRMLSKLEESNSAVQKRLQGSIDKFVGTSNKVGQSFRLGTVKGLTDFSLDPDSKKKDKKETKEQAFNRVSDELNALASPERMAELIQKRTAVMSEFAPETAGQLGLKLVTAVEFLRSHMPVNPAYAHSINPSLRKWSPSSVEMAKFERYVRAVEDPMSVVERFSQGIVDREGVQVLEQVYPEIFSSLQNRIMAEVAQLKEPLPYAKRLTIRSVFKISVDPTTDQEAVKQLQMTFAQTPETTPSQGSATKRPLELQNSLATPVEQLALV